MNDAAKGHLLRHPSKALILDANLLLLFVVGQYDQAQIQRFKRTSAFTEVDYELLQDIVNYFSSRLLTTPNILTEVNGMLNQLPEYLKPAVLPHFSQWVCQAQETYVESREVAMDPHFAPFRLTDLGIARASADAALVLTADSRLADYLNRNRVEAYDFAHLRHFHQP